MVYPHEGNFSPSIEVVSEEISLVLSPTDMAREKLYNKPTMRPRYIGGNVSAQCPSDACGGSLTSYEFKSDGHIFGYVDKETAHQYDGTHYNYITWRLLRCASCGAGGMVKLHHYGSWQEGVMESFYPLAVSSEKLPQATPSDIVKEFREAEKCAAIEAYRASSAMVRSTLEKILKAHGYTTGDLKSKIDLAVKDGVITASLGKRAHENVRVLGNDVLHDEWRIVVPEEVNESLGYTQRIIESFYDDPATVEEILIEKGRITKEKNN